MESIHGFPKPSGRPLYVCGEASDGRQAIEQVRVLKPEIVLLDINMPVGIDLVGKERL